MVHAARAASSGRMNDPMVVVSCPENDPLLASRTELGEGLYSMNRWACLFFVSLVAAACAPSPGLESPMISGEPVVGVELTATSGTWIFEPKSFAYAWSSCASEDRTECRSVGENSTRYTPTEEDLGRSIRVAVTAVNDVGSSTKWSARVGPVLSADYPPPSGSSDPVSITVVQGQSEWSTLSLPVPHVELGTQAPPADGVVPLLAVDSSGAVDGNEVTEARVGVEASTDTALGTTTIELPLVTCWTPECAGPTGTWTVPIEVDVIAGVPAAAVEGFGNPTPARLVDVHEGIQHVPDERVVTLDASAEPAEADRLASTVSASIVGGSVDLGAWVFRFPSASTAAAAEAVLRAEPSVFGVDHRLLGHQSRQDARLPDEYTDGVPDVSFTEYGGSVTEFGDAESQRALEQAESMNLPAAWVLGTGSESVRVGIVDGGMWSGHPDLEPNQTQNGVTRDDYRSMFTDSYHGQAVAGNACARGNNGIGLAGSAWECDLVLMDAGDLNNAGPIRGEDVAESLIDRAIEDGGNLDVVNLSYGTSACDGLPADAWPVVQSNLSYASAERWKRLFEKYEDTIFVTAAGNCAQGPYGFVNADLGYLDLPAGLAGEVANVVAVTSLSSADASGVRTVLGNYDDDMTTAASLNWWSTATTCNVNRTVVLGVTLSASAADCRHGYRNEPGTSFAAPRVSGVVALMLSANPSASPAEIKNCLKDSRMAGISLETVEEEPIEGFGALDAAAAVRCISPTPSLQVATQLSVGGNHSCALMGDTAVECWGWNTEGQLGNRTFANSTVPERVFGLSGVTQVAAGASHTCAISGGEVRCWGANYAGQLGNGSFDSSNEPVIVAGLSDVIHVTTGVAHTCAVDAGAGVHCWGNNGNGQLGDGTTNGSTTPVRVRLDGTNFVGNTELVAGGQHTCQPREDFTPSRMYCWGSNSSLQLGWPNPPTRLTSPAYWEPGGTLTSAGTFHNCFVQYGTDLSCWGRNNFGQLGDGTNSDSSFPQPVTGLDGSDIYSVSAGGSLSCASTTDNAVWCWGRNQNGQLGNGTTTDSNQPVPVGGLGVVRSVHAGSGHACALLGVGDVMCWGANNVGQLGDESTDNSSAPVRVAGIG